jgi:hypothetical protein
LVDEGLGILGLLQRLVVKRSLDREISREVLIWIAVAIGTLNPNSSAPELFT